MTQDVPLQVEPALSLVRYQLNVEKAQWERTGVLSARLAQLVLLTQTMAVVTQDQSVATALFAHERVDFEKDPLVVWNINQPRAGLVRLFGPLVDAARVTPTGRLVAVVDGPRVVHVETVHVKVFVRFFEDVHQVQLERQTVGCAQHLRGVGRAAKAAQNVAIPNHQRVEMVAVSRTVGRVGALPDRIERQLVDAEFDAVALRSLDGVIAFQVPVILQQQTVGHQLQFASALAYHLVADAAFHHVRFIACQ